MVKSQYPDLAKLFLRNGYALAIHGSLARDLDLIAVAWADEVESIETVLKEMMSTFAIRIIGEPETKKHGRIAYTLSVGFGECAVDLSFLPNTMNNVPR